MKKMKQSLQLFLTFAVCIFYIMAGSITAKAAGTLSVAFSANSVNVGDSLTVTVSVKSASGAEASTDMTIKYDSAKLQYVSGGSAGSDGKVTASGSSVNIKFKAIAAGSAHITAEGASVTAAGAYVTVNGASDTKTSSDAGTKSNTDTAAAPANTAASDDSGTSDSSNTTSAPADTTADTTAATGNNTVTIDGKTYTVSNDFKESEIPSGFVASTIEYNKTQYNGVIYSQGSIGMIYLINTADSNDRGFFIYDSDSNSCYPLISEKVGSHTIYLMIPEAGNVPPVNYKETTLTIDGKGTVRAYKYQPPTTDDETDELAILNTESATESPTDGGTETSADTTAATNDGSNFFLVFTIDENGTKDWYQYDKAQQTFQRMNVALIPSDSNTQNYDTLNSQYNILNDKYKSLKTMNRRAIVVLVFLSAVMLILIINLLLKIRELKRDDSDDYGDDPDDDSANEEDLEDDLVEETPRKEKRKPAPKKEKKTRKPVEDEFEDEEEFDDEDDFYEDSHPVKKKDKKTSKKPVSHKDTRPKNTYKEDEDEDGEDDDFEILDLNK